MITLGFPILALLLGILLASWSSLKKLSQKSMKKHDSKIISHLPPSPPKLPILGHLHLVGMLPHRSFHALAKKYGPIMYLKLGSLPIIVLSSPEMAERLLRNHDELCANRPVSNVTRDLSYGLKGLTFTPYNSHWRNVRKLSVMEALSPQKIRSFEWLRKEEVAKLVRSIKDASEANQPIDVGASMGEVLEELIYRMLFGSPKLDLALNKTVILEALRLSGTINISDYLTFLAPFDVQGLKRRIKKLMVTVDEVLEKIISNHEDESKREQRSHRDIVDVMVSIMRNNENNNIDSLNNNEPTYEMKRDNIKAVLFDLVVPAIDSATNLVKWALASLLKHPQKMKKLQEEIASVMGTKEMIEEKDIINLRYLDSVIKEIFRLYPIVFSPHETREEFSFDGYKIPKGAQIFLNSWAIGRDPSIWSDNCEEFIPERFLDDDIDTISGQDFRLAPFGFGRRRCPGNNLGLLNAKLLLSQLVHCFDWKTVDGSSPQDIVMMEVFGLVMSMAKDLVLIPKYRLNNVSQVVV